MERSVSIVNCLANLKQYLVCHMKWAHLTKIVNFFALNDYCSLIYKLGKSLISFQTGLQI